MQLTGTTKQYALITGNYWAFTLTDGALRMLVLLHFYSLGYNPLKLALLFVLYELFGAVTNLLGGWLGARIGLNHTMNLGLALQIIALSMLLVPSSYLSIIWVMSAQALSGIAKDLNKMSAKSAVKVLIPKSAKDSTQQKENKLYRWVAMLTGSKNALKGLGFFLGAALLEYVGFFNTILSMMLMLILIWLSSLILLKNDLGKAQNKPKFSDVFSKESKINILSAARLCLFASRDIWFVVALPVYLSSHLLWDFWKVGAFLALWIIAYGFIQTIAPKITSKFQQQLDYKSAFFWSAALTLIPIVIGLSFYFTWQTTPILLAGVYLFGIVLAINSSMHSYLIVSYGKQDGISLDVGFYYMANAIGRLIGTLLSGWAYQLWEIQACLWLSAAMLFFTALVSLALPKAN